METNIITNILFIDKNFDNYQIFVDSVNDFTFPIVYENTNSRNEIYLLLSQKNFMKINRIGFVFHEAYIYTFLDNQPLFLNNETPPFSENVEFILSIIKTYEVENIDFLACNTLNYKNWLDYYSIIEQNTSAIVCGSNNNTGNPEYGGDWIMENTNTDLQNFYFTDNIKGYTFLLGSTNVKGAANTMVITSNGYIYGAGKNDNGELGIGNTTNQSSLVQMTNNTGKTPVSVTSAYFTLVQMSDGTFYGCGSNFYGSFGNGTTSTSPQTTLIQCMTTIPQGKIPSSINGNGATYILMTDGTIWGCGLNEFGQLGIGNTTNQSSLVQLINNTGKIPASITISSTAIFILMSDGTIWACGRNLTGQLGIGNNTDQSLIVQMINNTGKTPKLINASNNTFYILMTDNTIYGCGSNFNGEFGNGTFYKLGYPYTTIIPIMTTFPQGKTLKSMHSGNNHILILMTDNTIYGTGNNFQGQLGIGYTTPAASNNGAIATFTQMIPVQNKTLSQVSDWGNGAIILMTDGTVYACGYNYQGNVGIGTTTTFTSGVSTLTQMISNGSPITNVVTLIGTIPPPTPAATTNYRCTISNNVVDLNTLFLPLTTQTPAPKTNYIIKNYNNTGNNYDFSNIFAPYVSGTVKSLPTKIIIFNYNNTGNNYDLSDIFQNINS